MIKTFRGLLTDGGQDRIRLRTIKGKVGYRITKLQVIPYNPGSQSGENTIVIWKTSTGADNATKYIDFTDSDLLAASYIQNGASNTEAMTITIIFDDVVFNQDIYITSEAADVASDGNNYYLELEVIPLDDKAAEYAILKDIRTHRTSAI